jgi:Putative restriction endonuclease
MSASFDPGRRLRTFRDVIDALPEHLTGQVIGGRLVVLPRPAPAHLNATGALREILGGPFQRGLGGPGGWWVLSEPELSLGVDPDFDPVNPDLAGWRRARMPHLPATATFALAPDWVCEVLSPSTEVHDRAEKMPFYARAGVEHAWLVDPLERTLEAFRRDGGTFRPIASHRGDVVVRVEPFDAVDVDLAYLWAR